MSSCAFANAISPFTESMTAFLRVSMSKSSWSQARSIKRGLNNARPNAPGGGAVGAVDDPKNDICGVCTVSVRIPSTNSGETCTARQIEPCLRTRRRQYAIVVCDEEGQLCRPRQNARECASVRVLHNRRSTDYWRTLHMPIVRVLKIICL